MSPRLTKTSSTGRSSGARAPQRRVAVAVAGQQALTTELHVGDRLADQRLDDLARAGRDHVRREPQPQAQQAVGLVERGVDDGRADVDLKDVLSARSAAPALLGAHCAGHDDLLGRQLGGKTLGIVGMGRIGQAVAHRARAFGLKIIYHNRRRLPAAAENIHGAEYVENVDDLIARCDILTLHCPSTPDTHHLVNAQRLALMKPGACVINTARAELVDEAALLDALESGHLAGAGLDVFEGEPQVNPRLLKQPNVMTVPHIGSATVEGREHAGEKVIANIRFWADGHRPPDQVLEGLV